MVLIRKNKRRERLGESITILVIIIIIIIIIIIKYLVISRWINIITQY